MKDLEAELGLKPGSFYAAFGSKDKLFALALDRYAKDSRERLGNLSDELGPLGALRALPCLIIEFQDAPAKACMLSKTLLELQAQSHPLADKAADYLDRMEDQFTKLFAQAQAAGDITSSRAPRQLASRYQSDLLGLRVTAERDAISAKAIAVDIARSIADL